MLAEENDRLYTFTTAGEAILTALLNETISSAEKRLLLLSLGTANKITPAAASPQRVEWKSFFNIFYSFINKLGK